MPDMQETARAKCILVGDPAVGKTAITQMFISEGSKFPKSYNLTFAIEPSTKMVTLDEEHNQNVEVLLYDSSGYDIYNEIFMQCWRNASLVLAVYDVTNEQSLENIAHWIQLIKEINSTNIPIVLFANKTDLIKRRVINSQKGEEMVQRLGLLKYIEGSAKDFEGVKEAFFTLAQQIVTK